MAQKHEGVLTNVAGTLGSAIGTIAAKTDELKRLLTKREFATKTAKRAMHRAGSQIGKNSGRKHSPKRNVSKASLRHRSGRSRH
jgi:hypothetical protein